MPIEKQTETIALRLTLRMFTDLSRLAAVEDRSISDYVRALVGDHLYGHTRILQEPPCERQQASGYGCKHDEGR